MKERSFMNVLHQLVQLSVYCLNYFHGKILKHKLTLAHSQHVSSLLAIYFCSQICLENFVRFDIDNLYLESLLRRSADEIPFLRMYGYKFR